MEKNSSFVCSPERERSPKKTKELTHSTVLSQTSSACSLKLQIWDTAGQEKYKAIAKLYYRDCRVAILVYDVTSKSSFESLKNWHEELIKHAPKNISNSIAMVVLYVVANKIDLLDLLIGKEEEQQVPYGESAAFAKDINAKFYEVSAKTRKGVEELFRNISESVGPLIYR